MTIVEPDRRHGAALFSDDLARHGEQPALITPDRSITYAELDDLVAGAALRLGVERRLVLVTAANTVDAIVAYLAALRAGQPVLLAPDEPATVHGLVDAYDPDVVVAAHTGWAPDERRASSAHDLHPDLALLLSTSGSTGSPKLVRLSRDNLHANAGAIARYLGITATDRAITTLPLQYCYGLSVVNSHLHAGAGIVLTDLSVVDRCFWQLFTASSATSLAGVPHTFDLLDRAGFGSAPLPSLRYVTQAGGRMHPDTVRRYAALGARDGWELFVMYGQTEATARMAYLPPALASTHAHTIGVPIPGGRFTIDAPDDGGVGELLYEGPNVMLGYAGQPADLALGRTVDVLATGDLARAGTDGLYEIVGRSNRFIKPCGLRIDLDRVEGLLADHGIRGVCTGDDEQLVIAVEHAHADVAVHVVRERTGLPRARVRVVAGAPPRLASGKPDYALVRQRALDRIGDAPACRGAADPRRAVATAFTEILGVEPTGDDTFVDLGGDSLSYVEMSIRLETVLGALPRDWHTTPISRLTPVAPARSRLAATDTTAVLRAVAIVLVVGTHADLWYLPGGAHTLLAVAGYNFARFQVGLTATFASIARVAAPSVCWIAAVAAVSDRYGWPNALLVNGIVERPGARWSYWFVEALVHILLALALLLAVPAIRRLDGRRPLAVPVATLAIGLLVRFDVIDLAVDRRTSRPVEVLWLFALGWCAARTRAWPQRLLLSAVTAAAVSGFFGDAGRETLIVAGILLCVWAPAVPLPRFLTRLVGPVAGASLYIYLTHWQVFPPLSRLHSPAVAMIGSVVAGVATWAVARRLTAATARVVRRRPAQREPECATR